MNIDWTLSVISFFLFQVIFSHFHRLTLCHFRLKIYLCFASKNILICYNVCSTIQMIMQNIMKFDLYLEAHIVVHWLYFLWFC